MNITIEGLDKLERDFRLIKDRASANQTERFCLEGAQELADLIRPQAPKGLTGNLRKGIRAFKAQRRGSYIGGAIGWIDRTIAPHLHLVVFGTKPHRINPKNKKAILERGPASEFVWAHVQHPGAKENHFFRDTVYRHAPRIAREVADKIARFMFPNG